MGFLEDGTSVRISLSSGAIIPKPDITPYTYQDRNKNKVDGPKDTKPE